VNTHSKNCFLKFALFSSTTFLDTFFFILYCLSLPDFVRWNGFCATTCGDVLINELSHIRNLSVRLLEAQLFKGRASRGCSCVYSAYTTSRQTVSRHTHPRVPMIKGAPRLQSHELCPAAGLRGQMSGERDCCGCARMHALELADSRIVFHARGHMCSQGQTRL
jgi:hypothetical protein